MTLTPEDLAAFARRIRPYFEPEFQDAAEVFARTIAEMGGGGRVRELRPETTLDEILSWLYGFPRCGRGDHGS